MAPCLLLPVSPTSPCKLWDLPLAPLQVYMLPESSGSGNLLLYRATRFPLEWKQEKVGRSSIPFPRLNGLQCSRAWSAFLLEFKYLRVISMLALRGILAGCQQGWPGGALVLCAIRTCTRHAIRTLQTCVKSTEHKAASHLRPARCRC